MVYVSFLCHAPFSSEKWEAKYLPKTSISLSLFRTHTQRRPSIHIMLVVVSRLDSLGPSPSAGARERERERERERGGLTMTKGFYYLFPIQIQKSYNSRPLAAHPSVSSQQPTVQPRGTE